MVNKKPIEQVQELNQYLEEWWSMILTIVFLYWRIKKYFGEALHRSFFGSLEVRLMQNFFRIKRFTYGMETAQNNIWTALALIDRKEI